MLQRDQVECAAVSGSDTLCDPYSGSHPPEHSPCVCWRLSTGCSLALPSAEASQPVQVNCLSILSISSKTNSLWMSLPRASPRRRRLKPRFNPSAHTHQGALESPLPAAAWGTDCLPTQLWPWQVLGRYRGAEETCRDRGVFLDGRSTAGTPCPAMTSQENCISTGTRGENKGATYLRSSRLVPEEPCSAGSACSGPSRVSPLSRALCASRTCPSPQRFSLTPEVQLVPMVLARSGAGKPR